MRPIPLRTTAITTTSSRNPTRHDRKVVRKPPSSGPTAAAIAAAAPTSAYACFWAAPWKLPWISDCMAGSNSDAASPPMIGQNHGHPDPADDLPEHDDRGEALGEGHRHSAERVSEQTYDEGPLAADEIADLAADEDERGRHQRLERDGALYAADRRPEVLDDLRDRHVHQRRVDDEHEHGRRQQHAQAPIGGGRLRLVRGRPAGQR